MKVYVLTAGDYSDYRVVAAFSSLDGLREYVKRFPAPRYDSYNEPTVFQVDPRYDGIPDGYSVYDVHMGRDFSGWARSESDINYPRDAPDEWSIRYASGAVPEARLELRLVVVARDEQHALKIAAEKLTQVIADGTWQRAEDEFDKVEGLDWLNWHWTFSGTERIALADTAEIESDD